MSVLEDETQPETIKNNKPTPREILYEEMYFYKFKANKLGNEIARIIKEGEKARGDLLFQLYKLMLENKETLVEIAAKLAPYEHAKLQSVEVKSEVKHSFVIRAPEVTKDTNTWLAASGQEITEPVTQDTKLLERAAQRQQEATELEDYELIEPEQVEPKKKPKNKIQAVLEDDDEDIIERYDS